MTQPKKLDFFIVHANKDKEIARELYNSITSNNCTAFLDKISIPYGTDWGEQTLRAQQNSHITVVLMSKHTEQGYYVKEEIIIGIQLSRKFPNNHKLVPVHLDGELDEDNLRYGLRLLQGIKLSDVGTIDALAKLLCREVAHFKEPGRAAVSEPGPEHHVLTDYPTGPMVPAELIPRKLIDSYARLVRQSEARLVITEANSFRREVNPDTKYVIQLHNIAAPEKIPAFDFWAEVFDYARLQGPRMLAALLLTVPDEQFEEDVREARTQLLKSIKNHSS